MRINDTIELDDGGVTISSEGPITIDLGEPLSFFNDSEFVGRGGDITIKAGNAFGECVAAGDIIIEDGTGRARIEMKDGNIRLVAKEIKIEEEPKEEEPSDDGRKLGKVTIVDESRLDDFKDPQQFKPPTEEHRGGFYNYGWKVAEEKKAEAKLPPKPTEWFLRRSGHYDSIMEAKRKFDVLKTDPKYVDSVQDVLNQLKNDDGQSHPLMQKPLTYEAKTSKTMKSVAEIAEGVAARNKKAEINVREAAKKVRAEKQKKDKANPYEANPFSKDVRESLKILNKFSKILEENAPLDPVKDANASVDHVKEILKSKPEYGGVSHGYTCSTNHGSPDGASFWRVTKGGENGLRYNNMKRRADNQKQLEDLVNKYIDDVGKFDKEYRKAMADVLVREAEVKGIIKSFTPTRACPVMAKAGLSEVVMNLNKNHVWKKPGVWLRIRNRFGSVGKWFSKKRRSNNGCKKDSKKGSSARTRS